MPKTHIENLYNEEGGIVNIHESPHIIPKALTTQTGLANDIDFVGRKEELQKVDELLNQNATLLLLNGIGGIGKSTLASYYLNQKKDEFDYYGFVQVNDDIKLSLASAFSTSLDLKSEKIDDLFAEIMNKLQNLEGKKLLIIDDVKEMDNQLDEINTFMTLKNSGFKILFTSREVKENIPSYMLPMMSKEDARDLFLKHFPTEEIDKVDLIIKKYLDYHTLFIEMTAKTLSIKSRLSLDKIIEKFENNEISIVKRDDIESYHKFLDNFSIEILEDIETQLFIKRLTLLPSIKISFDDLYKFLVCNDEDKLDEFLIKLVRKGWLIEFKEEGSYKFHQILRDYILERYKPQFEEIEVVVDYFNELMQNLHTIEETLSIEEYIDYLNSITSIIQNEKNEKTAYLLHSNGYLHFVLSKYTKAEKLYDISLKIREEILPENDILLAISYGAKASIYEIKANIEKALEFNLKSLKIRETNNQYPDKIAIGYNNVGRMYSKLGYYDEAFSFLNKSLDIRINIFGEEDESTAKAYNILGSFFQDISKDEKNKIVNMDNHKKAYEYLIKSFEIRKKILPDNHPSMATSYNNLATWYIEIENWDNAIKHLTFVLQNFTGRENQEILAQVNFNLGQVYFKKNKFEKAYEVTVNALVIWENIFSSEHPSIKTAKYAISLLEKLVT